MLNIIRSDYDHLLTSPYLTKKDDLGVPTISVQLDKKSFTRPSVTLGRVQHNVQAKDVMVRIHDHDTHVDFMVLDMGEDDDTPIILGRSFLNTTNAIIYVGSG